MPFSQIIPPSPTESKRLFYISVSLLLSRIQGYRYLLSKFHIYALVYCIGVFLSCLLHSVSVQFSLVQSLSHVQLFVTPWIAVCQASLSITNSRSSLRLTSMESVIPSSHLILCRPLLLLPPIPPSISLFQWVSSLHEVAKVLKFQHQSFQRTPRTDLL